MEKKKIAWLVVLLLAVPWKGFAQKDTLGRLSLGFQLLTHGEVQGGGLPKSATEENVASTAGFLLERTRLNVGYVRPGIEVKTVIQNSAVWGAKGNTAINLFEGWMKLSSRRGLFAQFGRVALSYDDERIIGVNDFAMAARSHDILRAGYEGHGHRVHAIIAYNQNGDNVFTNTYYIDGGQYYKTMQTLWYHYDFSRFPLGASLLLMNVGMQAGVPGDEINAPRVVYQQMLGGYVKYSPGCLTLEGSYYHQGGKLADSFMQVGKIEAWMATVKADVRPWKALGLVAGYDYLSGDSYVPVIYGGSAGLPRHAVQRSFTPLSGSRTKFYGLLDYYYQSARLNGFSPGLQNAFFGARWSPDDKWNLGATYHYLAVGTSLDGLDSTLGHDVDFSLSYRLNQFVSLEIGYTEMRGTETMSRLKQDSTSQQARWGWFSLVVSPNLLSRLFLP